MKMLKMHYGGPHKRDKGIPKEITIYKKRVKIYLVWCSLFFMKEKVVYHTQKCNFQDMKVEFINKIRIYFFVITKIVLEVKRKTITRREI